MLFSKDLFIFCTHGLQLWQLLTVNYFRRDIEQILLICAFLFVVINGLLFFERTLDNIINNVWYAFYSVI